MEQHAWDDDDALLAALGDALRSAGEMPEQVGRSGRAAWTWRTIDAELAMLVYDSLLEDSASVRGGVQTASRLLIFDGGQGASVEFEVTEDELVGQLLPPERGDIRLLRADETYLDLETDEVGCFALPIPAGPFRLLCRSGESTFTTDWVRL